jgi:zinc transport system substrate-binding protein
MSRVIVLFGILLPSVLLAKPPAAPRTILCTLYPLALVTQELVRGVSDVEIVTLVPTNHGCLHDYALKPGDVRRVQEAELVVMNGGAMEEGALHALLTEVAPERRFVALDALPTRELEAASAKADPHFFTDPELVVAVATALTKKLAAWDPAHAAFYRQNLHEGVARLKELREDIEKLRKLTASVPASAFSETVERFARRLGFSLVPVLHDSEVIRPSARQVRRAPRRLRESGVRLIFVDRNDDAKLARSLAAQVGAAVVALDPVVSGPDFGGGLAYYEAVMRNNLNWVKAALPTLPPGP